MRRVATAPPPARRSPALAAAAGALSDSSFASVIGGELLVSFDPAEAERAAVRGALAVDAAGEALPRLVESSANPL